MIKTPNTKYIVQYLLDKFDRSLSSIGQNKVNQHFTFHIDADSCPGYIHPNKLADTDEALKVFHELESLDFVVVKKDFSGFYTDVVLKTETEFIASARRFVGTEDPEGIAQHYHQIFVPLSSDPDPIISAFSFKMAELTKDHRHLEGALSYFKDEKTLFDILKAIRSIDALESETRERIFSIANFSDSKYFAVIQPKVDKIIREFSEQAFDEKDKPSRILGVVANPTFAMIKNGLKFKIGNQELDLSAFDSPFSLFDTMIAEMKVVGLNAKRVITIENETTFFDYNDPEALIVYLAGFHNRIRRDLLKKIYASCPDIEYLHWSDIDAGGFYITNHLKQDTGIPFKPFRMGVAELIKYKNLCKTLSPNDINRLNQQLEKPEMSVFFDVIRFMLQNNCKLEQEAFSAL
jgi:hypothetical protein